MSFTPRDLDELSVFLASTDGVMSLCEAAEGLTDPRVIMLRHDIDNDIQKSLRFAQWEHARGFHSTYFVLHTAPYYQDKALTLNTLHKIESLGHEIGIHNDAVTVALERGAEDPIAAALDILYLEISALRSEGFEIVGAAAHGSELCKAHGVNNMEVFQRFEPAHLGLEYAAYRLHAEMNANYVSDNGSEWRMSRVLMPDRQTHVLCHPQHWPV